MLSIEDSSQMQRERLDANVEAISRYRDANPELLRARHFLHDLPLNKDAGLPELAVMGVNPGERPFDRDAWFLPAP